MPRFFPVVLLLSLLTLSACGDGGQEGQQGQLQAEGRQGPPQGGPPLGAGGPPGQSQGQNQPPRPVMMMPVQSETIPMTQDLPGRVRAFAIAEIRPQVTGIIQSRLFEEGSFVEKGEQLYQIDPARYQADYDRFVAALDMAEAELRNTLNLRNRLKKLTDSNAISDQEYDDAQAAVSQARAAVALAEAEVQNTQIDLDYTKVLAPISGYIGPSAVTEGALVTNGQAMAMATIRQLDPVYIDVTQASADARNLQSRLLQSQKAGDNDNDFIVTVFPERGDEPYPIKGRLDATDLAVDEGTGTIRLRAVIENPNNDLLPGMFVRAAIADAGDTKSIIVPQAAISIQPDGSKTAMIVTKDNIAEQRNVSTGGSYKNNWIINSGLQEGEQIIVQGAMMLPPGSKVQPMSMNGRQNRGNKPSQTESQGE
jgi:membrane fusion protein (multidrug efflux system)